MKLSDALSLYLQRVSIHKKGYKQETYRVNTLLKHPIANKLVCDVTSVDIANYRDDRLNQKIKNSTKTVSSNTVRLEMALLSDLFNIARIEWGLAKENPVDLVRKPKLPPGRDRRLHLYEERRLLKYALSYCNPEMYSIIVIALETAMRQGEILKLRWENVNLRLGVASLKDTKNGSNRDVPLSIRAREAFKMLGVKPQGPIFSYTTDGFKCVFRALLDKLKIKDLHFHDLRHEAISRLFELGTLDMMEIASISGHKSLSMLKRYTHLKAHNLVSKLDVKQKTTRLAVRTFVPYPAKLIENDGGQFIIEFIDGVGVPGVCGDSYEDVMEKAKTVLLRFLARKLSAGKRVPSPSAYLNFEDLTDVVMIDPL